MTDRHDLDPSLSAEERERLAVLAERLERDRPLPSPAFRGELGRRLLRRRPSEPAAARFRLWVASYTVAGALCLTIAAIGLAGIGPFAA
jgi:hypothetical protein